MEQQIRFAAGGITLEGRVQSSQDPTGIGVVVCHPHPLYGGDMDNNVVTELTRALARQRHTTLRFNFRGVGDSGGTHGEGIAEIEDVTAAITALLAHHPAHTVVIAGYSFGAWVGLRAGAADPRAAKLVGVAPPVASRDHAFLETITKPTLLVCGERDSHAPLEAMRALASRLPPPSALTVVTGADHFFRGLETDISGAVLGFLRD